MKKKEIDKLYRKMIMTDEWYEKAKEWLKTENAWRDYDLFKYFCVTGIIHYQFKPKADFSICMALPPQVASIEYMNNEDKVIGRTVYGREKALGVCPYCLRPWSEHKGYQEPPIPFGYQGYEGVKGIY